MGWRQRRSSLKGSRPVNNLGPPILMTLTTSWGLADHETYGLWRALCHARWSTSVQFREQLIAFYPTTDDATRTFLHEACHPPRLMAVCEALVQEGYLTRQTASRIENRILESPWGAGWQGWTPPDGEDVQDVAAYVEAYWR
jgi:hypothetical protein